jgi:hypothetical protein
MEAAQGDGRVDTAGEAVVKVAAYLVLGRTSYRGKPRPNTTRIRRVTQGRPSLGENEAMIRLVLDIPDDAFEAPLFTVPVEKHRVAVAVEVDEP